MEGLASLNTATRVAIGVGPSLLRDKHFAKSSPPPSIAMINHNSPRLPSIRAQQ
ncbi:hypothetical protein CRG98_038652, partial [Punica granatum]